MVSRSDEWWKKNRCDDGHVGQVRAAAVGIVGDEDVAGLHGGIVGDGLLARSGSSRPRWTGICGGVDDEVAAHV